MEKQSRSILAILSTDIPSYTQITEEDESYAFTLIAKHRDIIKKYVSTSNGFTFKEMGDGTFNKFDSAIDASRCAIKIQNEAIERDLPLRIGVHLGDVVQEGDDILGIGVNIADRIQGLAKPGTIYISDDIFRQIKNQADLNTILVGEHELKGIKGKMTLYELVFNRDGTITERIEVTHKIQTHDEDGNKVEKEAPKSEFLKTLTMFFFDNKTDNSDLNWLQQGLTSACHYTLQQEKVLDIYQPSITERMEKAGYEDGVGLPNPLKKKITNQQNKDYWISGSILNHQDGYCITTELYDAKLGKLLQKREFIGDNIFIIIDNMALQLRYDLGIPASHIESTNNLSISDIYTNNIDAFKYYTMGRIALRKTKKTQEEVKKIRENYFEKALKHDQDFGQIYIHLAKVHFITGNEEKAQECLSKAMSLLYKYPEPVQYEIKSKYFVLVEKNPEKLIKLYELWVKLQPHNINAHKDLALEYTQIKELDKALEEYLIIRNMDPSSFDIVADIVEIYILQKDFKAAEKLLINYSNNYRENYQSYFSLGKLYEKMGELEKAREQYDIASLLEPNIGDIILRSIGLETKFGNFDLAINQLVNLANDNNVTKSEKYSSYQKLYMIYNILGQLVKSIDSAEKLSQLEPT